MPHVNRVLALMAVTIGVLGAVGSTVLNSLNSRIDALEARLAAAEGPSAANRQGEAAVEALAALTRTASDRPRAAYVQVPVAGDPPASPALSSVDDMIGRLSARLRQDPNNIEGWRMLGWSYFHTARYAEAAEAYARAVELDPTSADLRAAWAEALLKATGGTVAGEARALLDSARQFDPDQAAEVLAQTPAPR